MKTKVLMLAIALVLPACTAETPKAPSAPISSSAPCPVLGSRNWQAVLTRPVDAKAPATLLITGEADLPTPGYTTRLRQGLADRAMPPSQQIVAEFTPPDSMVTQVVTTEQVRFAMADALPRYRSIVIRCGASALATITEIQGQ